MGRILGLVAAAVVAMTSAVQAQQVFVQTQVVVDTVEVYSPMPQAALAITTCLGGRAKSVIDIAIIGTDSLAEIVAHEKVHIKQVERAKPGCPKYASTWDLLAAEVEAYCVSRHYRAKRPGWTLEEANKDAIARLQNQMNGAINKKAIETYYRENCK